MESTILIYLNNGNILGFYIFLKILKRSPMEHAVTRRFTTLILPCSLDYNPLQFSLSLFYILAFIERA